MATTAARLGDNLIKLLTGRTTSSLTKAALLTLQVATDGTQEASKFITTDSNTYQGVVKSTQLHIGTSGSETQVNATGAEINQAFDLTIKGEVLTANRTLTVADGSKVFFLNAVAGLTVTLPVLATVDAGWTCRVIVKTATTSNAYIITETVASDTNKIATNFIVELETDNAENGPSNAGHTTITFDDTAGVVGDWVEIETDGALWYAHGLTNADGGITLA